jgi:hypothetical protein
MQRTAVGASGDNHYIGGRQLYAAMSAKLHPGIATRRQQAIEQRPVIHRQVSPDPQCLAHLRAERGLDLPRLPAGKPLDRASAPGQLLADPV